MAAREVPGPWWLLLAALLVVEVARATHECALYLSRAPVVPYAPNSIFPYGSFGSSVCITHGDVNAAFELARSKLPPITPPHDEYTPETVAPVGQLLLDTSRILAQRFSLSSYEIFYELPRLDVSHTAVAEVCPDFASPMTCVPTRYRRHDGLCNNLLHPTWGATRTVFNRLISPVFADGIAAPRLSVGHPYSSLPNPRRVSAHIHRDDGYHDHAISLLFLAWGQFMDHDFTLTATPLDPETRNEPERNCCVLPEHQQHQECLEIRLPKDDQFYSLFHQDCLEFFRGLPGVRQDCKLGVRAPFNILTSVIDVNTVYGGSHRHANRLREGVGGLMKMNNVFKDLGLRELLPTKTDFVDEGCTRSSSPTLFCFEAGEIRVNEQLILTTIHTLWFREHNRICKELSIINPHWDDETLYQETRHIVSAMVQHITFHEFLPLLLGEKVMRNYGLTLEHQGYWDGYDPATDPSMTAAFITAAFRFGHSLLPSAVERWSPSNKFMGSVRLSRLIRQPFDLYRAGVLDEYYIGLTKQPVQAMDDAITQEVFNIFYVVLYKSNMFKFNINIGLFYMYNNRTHKTPSHTSFYFFRKFCGLPPITNFHELASVMTNVTAHRYADVYSHVDDIDLWSAGVSERPLEGSLLGPTFSCIVATQMQRVRRGDRFWFELPGQPSSFTPAQLASIRTTRLARVLCDNTDRVEEVQRYPMLLADPHINPVVRCGSGQLTRLDLSPWRHIH
ncbi:peroxidase [Hyalella azteca]|uniref:Peroxidase n=1 Tax=Hyalella azteca TaxID=294128 RepID=A0A979FNY0_HYAAZ|nr:peroxidase [Hyalella azteca]